MSSFDKGKTGRGFSGEPPTDVARPDQAYGPEDRAASGRYDFGRRHDLGAWQRPPAPLPQDSTRQGHSPQHSIGTLPPPPTAVPGYTQHVSPPAGAMPPSFYSPVLVASPATSQHPHFRPHSADVSTLTSPSRALPGATSTWMLRPEADGPHLRRHLLTMPAACPPSPAQVLSGPMQGQGQVPGQRSEQGHAPVHGVKQAGMQTAAARLHIPPGMAASPARPAPSPAQQLSSPGQLAAPAGPSHHMSWSPSFAGTQVPAPSPPQQPFFPASTSPAPLSLEPPPAPAPYSAHPQPPGPAPTFAAPAPARSPAPGATFAASGPPPAPAHSPFPPHSSSRTVPLPPPPQDQHTAQRSSALLTAPLAFFRSHSHAAPLQSQGAPRHVYASAGGTPLAGPRPSLHHSASAPLRPPPPSPTGGTAGRTQTAVTALTAVPAPTAVTASTSVAAPPASASPTVALAAQSAASPAAVAAVDAPGRAVGSRSQGGRGGNLRDALNQPKGAPTSKAPGPSPLRLASGQPGGLHSSVMPSASRLGGTPATSLEVYCSPEEQGRRPHGESGEAPSLHQQEPQGASGTSRTDVIASEHDISREPAAKLGSRGTGVAVTVGAVSARQEAADGKGSKGVTASAGDADRPWTSPKETAAKTVGATSTPAMGASLAQGPAPGASVVPGSLPRPHSATAQAVKGLQNSPATPTLVLPPFFSGLPYRHTPGVPLSEHQSRFLALQSRLKEVEDRDYSSLVEALQGMSAAERSRRVSSAEKRSLQLVVEEGHEMHRAQRLGVLAKRRRLTVSASEEASPLFTSMQTATQISPHESHKRQKSQHERRLEAHGQALPPVEAWAQQSHSRSMTTASAEAIGTPAVAASAGMSAVGVPELADGPDSTAALEKIHSASSSLGGAAESTVALGHTQSISPNLAPAPSPRTPAPYAPFSSAASGSTPTAAPEAPLQHFSPLGLTSGAGPRPGTPKAGGQHHRLLLIPRGTSTSTGLPGHGGDSAGHRTSPPPPAPPPPSAGYASRASGDASQLAVPQHYANSGPLRYTAGVPTHMAGASSLGIPAHSGSGGSSQRSLQGDSGAAGVHMWMAAQASEAASGATNLVAQLLTSKAAEAQPNSSTEAQPPCVAHTQDMLSLEQPLADPTPGHPYPAPQAQPQRSGDASGVPTTSGPQVPTNPLQLSPCTGPSVGASALNLELSVGLSPAPLQPAQLLRVPSSKRGNM